MAEVENLINEPSDAEKRIKQLSDKVKLTSEERDEKERLLQESATKIAATERERDFYAGFSDVVATNPNAKDFKDDIKSKVLAGYSVEDATFAVLGKAGKLGAPAPAETPSPAGGSAVISLPDNGGAKSISEMTQAERRQALMENEADVLSILSPKSQ